MITSDILPLVSRKEYKSLKSFYPEEILQLVGENEKAEIEVNGVVYTAKLDTQRLLSFKKSVKCSKCGRVGTIISLDNHISSPNSLTPHFNLYCVEDGKFLLMTRDHIVPLKKNGKNSEDNSQTLCEFCNSIKGANCERYLPNSVQNCCEITVVEKILLDHSIRWDSIEQPRMSHIMFFYEQHRGGRGRRKISAEWNRKSSELRF